MLTRIHFLTVLILTTATIVAPCCATILNVPADHADITTALGVAVAGDEVVVAAGTYLEHDLILPSGVVLRGATGDPADVIINGQRAGRCVYGENLDTGTRLESLTLYNGLPAWGSTPHNSWGAGLMVDGGSLTVENCVFSENETAIGGGAFVFGTGSPSFIDCVFDNNSATESSGLFVGSVGDLVVKRCEFRNGNRCMYGGGLSISNSGQALIEDCTIEDNEVLETGGGVEVFGYTTYATLRRCVIRRNHSDMGDGGLSVTNNGHVIMENCEITGNSADLWGGGVGLGYGTELTAIECTILNNTAPNGPDGDTADSSTATLTCCNIDLAAWNALGTLTIVDDDCDVGNVISTWGDVKALYR
jgi:hypothetical protein